ncbi:hypothetical protein [Streptomyces sp. NPDC005322]|uniref:hypothetical protein n=1 Tax=unclassified Streptomyces TaxID=2593676 RepID=UPI0033BC88D6
MGSLRNPIGPLPSSIYWRRRAVALALLVAIALLVIWAFGWGGSGGGGSDEGKGPGGGPASTITPGPSSSGPVNSQRPGGRDESDNGGTGSGDTGGSGSGGSGGGAEESGGGAGGGSGGASGSGGGSGGGADGIGTGTGQSLPVGSSLPDCTRGDVELTVRSVKDSKAKNTYAPGEKPTFEIVVKNSSKSSCKVDFGRAAASLTITDADNAHIWASGDCPEGSATALVEVPGSGETKRTVRWDRKRSAEHCATPKGSTSAEPGTYLVEAELDGIGTAQVSFVLEKD